MVKPLSNKQANEAHLAKIARDFRTSVSSFLRASRGLCERVDWGCELGCSVAEEEGPIRAPEWMGCFGMCLWRTMELCDALDREAE